jgi:hypothetical protein
MINLTRIYLNGTRCYWVYFSNLCGTTQSNGTSMWLSEVASGKMDSDHGRATSPPPSIPSPLAKLSTTPLVLNYKMFLFF